MARCYFTLLAFGLALIVLVCPRSACIAGELEGSSHRGMCCVFIRNREILTGESWRGKPLDVLTASKNIGKYDAILCAQMVSKYNRPVWQYARKTRPDQVMLYYISACTVRPNNPLTQLNYDYINTHHPEWFLLNGTKDRGKADPRNYENRIRWHPNNKKSPHYNRFFLDIGNEDFRKWAAQQFLEYVSGRKQGLVYAYDGLGMDNVEIGKKHFFLAISRWHPHWEYAGRFDAWNKAFCDYLKVVKDLLNKHDFLLIVNHTLDRTWGIDQHIWDRLYESADGLMTEQSLRHGWGESPYFTEDKWLKVIKQHEDISGKGLSNWWICVLPEKGKMAYESFLYTYCSWLLIKNPGRSFYYASRGKSDYANPIPAWYDEYDLPIGNPVGGRYFQDSCWLRDYENAKIVVNPTKQTQTVRVDNEKLWLDWVSKKTINQLELPAQSARMLLPTPYESGTFGR